MTTPPPVFGGWDTIRREAEYECSQIGTAQDSAKPVATWWRITWRMFLLGVVLNMLRPTGWLIDAKVLFLVIPLVAAGCAVYARRKGLTLVRHPMRSMLTGKPPMTPTPTAGRTMHAIWAEALNRAVEHGLHHGDPILLTHLMNQETYKQYGKARIRGLNRARGMQPTITEVESAWFEWLNHPEMGSYWFQRTYKRR